MRHHARAEDAPPTLLIGRAADAEIRAARHRKRRHQADLAGRHAVAVARPIAASLIRNIPVLGGIDDIEDVIRDFAKRDKPIARVVMTPSAFDAEAHPEVGSDARAPARPDRQPPAVAGGRRRAAADAMSRSRTCCCVRARRSTTRGSRRW